MNEQTPQQFKNKKTKQDSVNCLNKIFEQQIFEFQQCITVTIHQLRVAFTLSI